MDEGEMALKLNFKVTLLSSLCSKDGQFTSYGYRVVVNNQLMITISGITSKR